jgi:hypothetical protein
MNNDKLWSVKKNKNKNNSETVNIKVEELYI